MEHAEAHRQSVRSRIDEASSEIRKISEQLGERTALEESQTSGVCAPCHWQPVQFALGTQCVPGIHCTHVHVEGRLVCKQAPGPMQDAAHKLLAGRSLKPRSGTESTIQPSPDPMQRQFSAEELAGRAACCKQTSSNSNETHSPTTHLPRTCTRHPGLLFQCMILAPKQV